VFETYSAGESNSTAVRTQELLISFEDINHFFIAYGNLWKFQRIYDALGIRVGA
jgi:hypothetical protein